MFNGKILNLSQSKDRARNFIQDMFNLKIPVFKIRQVQ